MKKSIRILISFTFMLFTVYFVHHYFESQNSLVSRLKNVDLQKKTYEESLLERVAQSYQSLDSPNHIRQEILDQIALCLENPKFATTCQEFFENYLENKYVSLPLTDKQDMTGGILKRTHLSLQSILELVKKAEISTGVIHNLDTSFHIYVPTFYRPLEYPYSQYDYQYWIDDVMFAPLYAWNDEDSVFGINGIALGKIGDSHVQVIAKIEKQSKSVIRPEMLSIRNGKLTLIISQNKEENHGETSAFTTEFQLQENGDWILSNCYFFHIPSEFFLSNISFNSAGYFGKWNDLYDQFMNEGKMDYIPIETCESNIKLTTLLDR